MAALARIDDQRQSCEYEQARRVAAERLRSFRARHVAFTAAEWREITRGEHPEVSGRWREPERGR